MSDGMNESERALRQWVCDRDPEVMLADGFETAFIGLAKRCSKPSLALYDSGKCIEILMTRDGMNYEDAVECFEFNTLGAWMGKRTPLFLERYEPEE